MTPEEREELEANRFAIELLMPPSLVETWVAAHPGFTVAEFADAFKVGYALAVRRLIELEIDFDIAEEVPRGRMRS